MEQSKLISRLLAKLKLAYPYYFEKLNNESFLGLISLYQENLGNYNEETINYAINLVIKENKFMPSMATIVDYCENNKKYPEDAIIERMIEDGYLKTKSDINKAYMWLECGIIPEWFQKAMERYKTKQIGCFDQNKISSEEQNELKKLLEGFA